jgi:hypothetical protein
MAGSHGRRRTHERTTNDSDVIIGSAGRGKMGSRPLATKRCNLDRLCLHSKLIKDVCAKELAEALKTNKTTDLFLKRNGIITAVDAEELAEALRIFL